MAELNQPHFRRAPSPKLQEELKKGYLKPLLNLSKRKVGHCNIDMHFRPGDKVQFYCGRASLVSVNWKNDKFVEISANKSYINENFQGKLRWSLKGNDKKFEQDLNEYLDNIMTDHRMMKGEGLVQDKWSCIESPWVSVDRESGFEYNSTLERDQATIFPMVDEARKELSSLSSKKGWKKPTKKLARRQIDQLAVDSEGNLVLCELKSALGSIYYTPFQLLEYVYEWREAFKKEAIVLNLNKLIEAKIDLNIIPEVPPLTGRIRAAVCFGCDNRSRKVKKRYGKVLDVVNAHLPMGVPPIETWSLGKCGPQLL